MVECDNDSVRLRTRVIDEYLPAGLAAAIWVISALTLPMGVELLFLATVLSGGAIASSAILRWGHRRLSTHAAVAEAALGGVMSTFGLMSFWFFHADGVMSALLYLVVSYLFLITAAWRIRISTPAEES